MRIARAAALFALFVLASGFVCAKDDPVQWTLQPAKGFERVRAGAKIWLEFKATVEPGWHLYSPTTPPGGPIATTISLAQPGNRLFKGLQASAPTQARPELRHRYRNLLEQRGVSD